MSILRGEAVGEIHHAGHLLNTGKLIVEADNTVGGRKWLEIDFTLERIVFGESKWNSFNGLSGVNFRRRLAE